MDCLPEELIFHIFSYLAPHDLARVQNLSHRYYPLARDGNLWKEACFENSRLESFRRRRELLESQASALVALRRAMNTALPDSAPTEDVERETASAGPGRAADLEIRRIRAFSDWDPTWPGERPDFYREYVHRHAPIHLDWLQPAVATRDSGTGSTAQHIEALGLGILQDHRGLAERVLAPLEDGSVALWELATERGEVAQGHIIARSPEALLTGTTGAASSARLPTRPSTANETGAIDNVAIDSAAGKAYIAVLNTLVELDINTLQVVRRTPFPFSISCLSKVIPTQPLVVGTNMTIHLHDMRANPALGSTTGLEARCELIGGTPPSPSPIPQSVPKSHAILSQPGPLSIVVAPSTTAPDSIWVGGRFSTLLNYSLRNWPRLQSTIFSGARLSSLSLLPYASLPHDLSLSRQPGLSPSDMATAKALPGTTILAAGEYRGKGSLELHTLTSPSDRAHSLHPPTNTLYGAPTAPVTSYANRQTAAKSRLLSATAHGQRLVFSDADGTLKWVERDAFTEVRRWNINDAIPGAPRAHSSARNDDAQDLASALFGAHDRDGDFVQRIAPVSLASSSSSSSAVTATDDDLLLWTGDGRIGLLGFRGRSAFDGGGAAEGEDDGPSDEESAREREERRYGAAMRRALKRQADETRFVQGLGLGFGGRGGR